MRAMTATIDTDAQVAAGMAELIAREPRFGPILAAHGPPPLRRAAPGLAGLLRIVTDQMISRGSAEAIWRRVERALHPFEPQAILAREVDDLKAFGLTGAKARAFLAAARAVHEGTCALDRLPDLSDDEAIRQLTRIPGIGPWTADSYLLSSLGRADAFPAGDLALQIAAQDLFGLEARPVAPALRQAAQAWRPWRGIAARLLWSHYRHLKGLPQSVL